ncbi:MAG: hypothetical protein NC310_06465 [Roseburia sp.]|nr:hypothetical protein [Anaeroplasma bactoclasticum]MCM1196692.1 hypothetical protein [Roseburia sp.]MCM1556812.1 hypothetical protein [Anaeroplasma bactoclasticum]
MKKVLSVILCLCFLCFMSSCTKKTEYDDKTIAKIETECIEGMGFGFVYKRIFDFADGKVYDITLADETIINLLKGQYVADSDYYKEYASLEEYESYINSCYNTLIEIATFPEEEGKVFLKKIISLGIYTWKESYTTDEIIFDGGSENIKIFFTDGTEKRTHIYFKYPKNYERILETFKKHFNVGCWNGTN